MRSLRKGAAALGAVVLLAGCGGNARRDAVNDYFDQVADAQATLVTQTASIQNALAVYTLSGTPPPELQRLERARGTLAATKRRIDALEPPSDARRLHADLVRMLELETSVTADLVWSARYVPQLERALRPLEPAGKALTSELRAARGFEQQAAAFERYRRALQAVRLRLDKLRAPPELRASLVGERTLVRRSAELSGRIAAALRRHDSAAAGADIRKLAGLSVGEVAVRARRGQIAAARAYNRRLATISRLAGAVVRERLRLVEEVG